MGNEAYVPKYGHIIITMALSISFGCLWAKTTDRMAIVMLSAAGVFLIITAIIVFSLVEGAHYYSVTAYIEALVKMDSDLRNALAFNIPSLRLIAKRGQVQTLFADTRATKEHIHLFLQDSTRISTASRRNWVTAERPRWAWDEIYNYLVDRNMVGSFATGPESYPWIGTAYQNLCVYFLSISVPNLDESSRVFAEETGTWVG